MESGEQIYLRVLKLCMYYVRGMHHGYSDELFDGIADCHGVWPMCASEIER